MEFKKDDVAPYVDSVITFEELQALFDSKDIDVTSLEEEPLENASYYGRIFARNCGLSEAVKEGLLESGLDDFDLKAVPCDGIEACRIALLKAQKRMLDGNFIEGMACVGGCIGGAGCLTHGERNKVEVDKHGKQSKKADIKTSVNDFENHK
jgi:iron only hydrogenase large subunit-like protein